MCGLKNLKHLKHLKAGKVRCGLFFGFPLALAVYGGLGCAENESSIFIRQVQAPSSDCLLVADPGTKARAVGVLDVALAREYRAGLLIGNQLVARGSSEDLRTETSAFRAEGLDVRVERIDGSALSEFSTAVTGLIWPGSSSSPGWGMVSGVIMDRSSGDTMASTLATAGGTKRVVSVLKVYGKTLGGHKLESGAYRFPIDLCYGCLVYNSTRDDTDAGSSESLPCAVGQDDAISRGECGKLGFEFCR